MRTRPLTAQEAFEQEGFIVAISYQPRYIGEVVESCIGTVTGAPAGTQLKIIGEISREESDAYGNRVGWPPEGFGPVRFYKATAE